MADLANYDFTAHCPCGRTSTWVDGVEEPHKHAEITPQMVREAWAAGYEYGRTGEPDG